MSSEDTYNGWTNYPTWCVNLWLSNEQGLYDWTRELVAETVGNHDPSEPIRVHVADAIRDFVRNELAPDLGATFAADLLGYALDEVNWYEIADAWLEESVPA